MSKKELELLAPAKDLETGIAAIDCGADAVYIGAPKFGARSAAGNSIEDISKLVEYAHKFWAKVYVTVNTVIYDDELDEVKKIIEKLYRINVDAVIFQDMALLEMNLPPIQLFASTQMHNYEIDRIKFLDGLGVKRIILARELSIDQIKKIKSVTDADLEFFVHGALCVCLSGQCYMSEAMFGRSANRGECAQPCRLKYSLIDSNGKIIVKDKHLLSIRDLNLSAHLNDLLEAGITSFKVEGRLKDSCYVKNITAYYRKQIDAIIENNPKYKKASSGYSQIPFEPDPEKTFNRGYTSYFIKGKDKNLSSIDSPKSKGKFIGNVIKITKNSFTINTKEQLVNGDGLCFYNSSGELVGMNVNKIELNTVFTDELGGIKTGTEIFRNHDHAFLNQLKKKCERKIRTEIFIEEIETGLQITAKDEDGILITIEEIIKKEPAKNGFQAVEIIKKQFAKSGDTIFEVSEVEINIPVVPFIPVGSINEMRRNVLSELERERVKQHKIERRINIHSESKTKESHLNYRMNVVNKLSKQFYEKHGAEEIEDGFELQNKPSGKIIMTCKYCIKEELKRCSKKSGKVFEEPLFLIQNNHKYQLVFDCKECSMKISYC
jgi:23S rRNA 5-hydroxycytidine C2501 synthase